MNAFYDLLHDWFPKSDFTLAGIKTLLSMAEMRGDGASRLSPLDLLFRQAKRGERYARDPNGDAWSWQSSKMRRNYDGKEPGACGGLRPSEDRALGFYTEFCDYPAESQNNAAQSLAFRLLAA